MAYFNHAFNKVFLGTQDSGPGAGQNPNPNLVDGFIITAGKQSVELGNTSSIPASNYGVGSYGFFVNDPSSGLISVDTTYFSYNTCCPLTLASASLLSKDKLNQYTGGYKESNKSKLINPKYIQKVYRVDSCTPQQAVISVGTTPQTIIPGLPADNFQGGTVQANCCYNFLCGETYYLRIDIKGSPALRFLNHNAYQTLSAYTGCCTGPTPTNVDPTLVYIEWAKALVINNYLKDLAAPVVYDYTQVAWYAPGTTVTYDGTNTPVTPAEWWTNYPASAQAIAWTSALPNTCEAGLRLFGAYVETKFGNCSFQVTDFFEKEPVRLYASLVDYNGDPCVFEGLCVYNDCRGIQGMGFGEQVVRDLILSERYLQNFFATDIRIREITQGDQILNSVDRNALYTRYYILHSVPRFNNPTGTFDNDRYMLEIISNGTNAALEAFLTAWLASCPNCVELETEDCTRCCVVTDGGVVPTPPC
jgi:hypothetical protein